MEDDEEATPWKEQENWEADQIKKASMTVGTQNRKKGQKQYDLVLPDQIDFITDMVMAGDVVSALPCSQMRFRAAVTGGGLTWRAWRAADIAWTCWKLP